MMGFLKRRWWMVLTLGTMLVLVAVCLVFAFIYVSQKSRYVGVLERSRKMLGASEVFCNSEAVKKISEATEFRQAQLEGIVDLARQRGQWEVLIPQVFPSYRDNTQVFAFRNAYPNKIQDFMQTLNALDPEKAPAAMWQNATVYVGSKTFYMAPWISDNIVKTDRDTVQKDLCDSQDDLWLMEDIVRVIKQTNDEYFKAEKVVEAERTLARAVVKEIQEIVIGADNVESARGGAMTSGGRGRRYRTIVGPAMGGPYEATGGEEPETQGRAKVLTGRASNNNKGTYKVLPFRLVVTADAGNHLELVRQLSGTRSFITVDSVVYEVIPETDSSYRNYKLLRPNVNVNYRLQAYGKRALACVKITGESLIFQMDGARPTVLPKKAEGTAAGSE